MDFIFELITPYIDFCGTYYSKVLIISLILATTGLITYLQICNIKKDLIDTEGVSVMAAILIIGSFAWPVVFFFLGLVLIGLFYYYFIGFLIKLIFKRLT